VHESIQCCECKPSDEFGSVSLFHLISAYPIHQANHRINVLVEEVDLKL